MIRHRKLFLTALALLSISGLPVFAPSFMNAQAQDYLPPQNLEPPRSIKPPRSSDQQGSSSSYSSPSAASSSGAATAYASRSSDNPGYGQPYSPPPAASIAPDNNAPPPPGEAGTYSSNEILDAGRSFFGGASEGLAKVVEYSFRKNGRPTGYILGEEGSGAIVAGLRYGEGMLYAKGFPPQKVYWQGPSLGYDFGANGSKTFTLVYNMQDPSQIYERFGGIDGSAYLVGGVGITFQQHDDIVLAPIRAGVGLRLGANLGYLKYTSSPTWNPF